MRGYAPLISNFRARRYNVLVLQQMSYAAPRHSHGIDRLFRPSRSSRL